MLKCQKSGRFTPENCHRHPKYICHLTNCTSINPLRPRRVPLVQENHVKLPLRNCGALMTRLLQPQTKRVRSDLKYTLAYTRSAFRLPASSPLRLPASKWALTKNSVMANLNLNFNTYWEHFFITFNPIFWFISYSSYTLKDLNVILVLMQIKSCVKFTFVVGNAYRI